MKYLFNFSNIIAAESLKKETRLGRDNAEKELPELLIKKLNNIY